MGRDAEVDAWFAEYRHPAKDAMERLREIILSDERISESIKWRTPTFSYRGNFASINPRTKAHVSLVVHTGAHIPGEHPLLHGGGSTARYVTFDSRDQVEEAADQIRALVDAWCAYRQTAQA